MQGFGLLMVLLIVSYLPAVILGISEGILSTQFLYGQTHKCSAIPMWHHQLGTINQLFQRLSVLLQRANSGLILARAPPLPPPHVLGI